MRLLGTRNREFVIVADFASHDGSLAPFGEPRSDGSKNVPPMKSFAYGMQIIMFDIGVAHDESFRFALENDREHAVDGGDKILILRADQQLRSLGSHAGVHHHNMNRFRR